mgnify:CR=1 FL=1
MTNKNEFKGIENIKYVGEGLFMSTNYDLFHFYKGNRYTILSCFDENTVSSREHKDALNKQKVIEKSFRLYAQEQNSMSEFLFDKDCPILIAKLDGEYLIVEGQNRLAFCAINSLPFYFRLLHVNNSDELMSFIKRFNYTKNAWTKSQQIGSEARLGNKYAQEIINIEKKYEIPQNIVIYFTLGKSAHKSTVDFTVTPFDITNAHKIAKIIRQVAFLSASTEKKALSLMKDNRYANFIIKMMETNQKSILLKAAHTHKVNKIKGATCIANYADAFGLTNYI